MAAIRWFGTVTRMCSKCKAMHNHNRGVSTDGERTIHYECLGCGKKSEESSP